MTWQVTESCLMSYLSTILCLLLGWLVWTQLFIIGKRKGPLPPGPKGWPLIGYIPFVLAQNPTELMLKQREKYGNIFGFRVGVHYCVMLSDYKSVRMAFTKKQYLDRPAKYMRMSRKHSTLAELQGSAWEEQRQFLHYTLKELGIGRMKFEDKVMDELTRTIPKMAAQAGKEKCNIRDAISGSMNNIVLTLVCGRWFEDDEQIMKDFSHFQKVLVESFSNNMPVIYYPWIDWFLVNLQPRMRDMLKSAAKIEQFVRSQVEVHELNHTENNDRDYMDLYITERKMRIQKNTVSSFTREQLVYNSLLLLLAATDTVRNTLEWLIMAMAAFPHVQSQVHEEIDKVLGQERLPQYSDKKDLPYTEAVMLESERWKTLEPLNLLRKTTDDSYVRGYFIPKGTVVMNNLHFCHMDPDYWKSPEEFLPQRFLSQDQSRVIVPEFFIPFSVGKRDCPGDKMANIELFLYFSALMQKFKFTPPDGGINFSASHRMNLQAHFPIVKVDLR